MSGPREILHMFADWWYVKNYAYDISDEMIAEFFSEHPDLELCPFDIEKPKKFRLPRPKSIHRLNFEAHPLTLNMFECYVNLHADSECLTCRGTGVIRNSEDGYCPDCWMEN